MKLGARWGDRTPVEVRELVAGDGRVLAWCAAGEGGFAAATDERLRCSDPELDARWPQIQPETVADIVLDRLGIQREVAA